MLLNPVESIPIFRFRGIRVGVHWMWLVWGINRIYYGQGAYTSVAWDIAEYLALFLIVLLHEFGHAFACRQTGGKADKIVLWPFGGIAFVQPVPRPGAELWSIAAGPLVNVVLFPLLMAISIASREIGWSDREPDLGKFLYQVWSLNQGMLIFNLLPIYPLDGGQILRSLLWFKIGRAKSLRVASAIGLVGIPALLIYAFTRGRISPSIAIFLILMAVFLLQSSWSSWKHAGVLLQLEAMPRHRGFACPACAEAPPSGALWLCASCGNRYDPFVAEGRCPHCGTARDMVPCATCGVESPLARWDHGPSKKSGNGPVIDV